MSKKNFTSCMYLQIIIASCSIARENVSWTNFEYLYVWSCLINQWWIRLFTQTQRNMKSSQPFIDTCILIKKNYKVSFKMWNVLALKDYNCTHNILCLSEFLCSFKVKSDAEIYYFEECCWKREIERGKGRGGERESKG